jgi:hypothetical protein
MCCAAVEASLSLIWICVEARIDCSTTSTLEERKLASLEIRIESLIWNRLLEEKISSVSEQGKVMKKDCWLWDVRIWYFEVLNKLQNRVWAGKETHL